MFTFTLKFILEFILQFRQSNTALKWYISIKARISAKFFKSGFSIPHFGLYCCLVLKITLGMSKGLFLSKYFTSGQSYTPMTPGGMYADYTAPSPYSRSNNYDSAAPYSSGSLSYSQGRAVTLVVSTQLPSF